MSNRLDEAEREMLVKNVDFTLEKVRVVSKYNTLVRDVNEKIWDLPVQAHLFLMAAVAALISWLVGIDLHNRTRQQSITVFLVGIVVYMLFVYLFNRVVIMIRKTSNGQELQRLSGQRKQALVELRKYSEIPETYWQVWYLEYMKQSLDNGLADTMKECINNLEEEIAYRNEMKRLKKIEQADRRRHEHEHDRIHL
jgi:hypothetical protein